MERDLLLLSFLSNKNVTANETIHSIYRYDVKNGLLRADWKFYLHLNKRFAPLTRKGLIMQIGTKVGPSNRPEKVWGLTALGASAVQSVISLAA